MKIHHCIADGIATMHMLAGLSRRRRGDTFVTKIHAANRSRRSRRVGCRSPALTR